MSRRKRQANEWMNLAANLGREDGGDPREFHSKPWNAPRKANRKGQQLCEQVREALLTSLPGCADRVLQSLVVVGVQPAPNSGRLLILVAIPGDVDQCGVTEALSRANGFLRAQVAAAIHRRRAPELSFEVIRETR